MFFFLYSSEKYLRFTGLCCRNDTGTLNEGVGKGGFAVVDVSNNALHCALVILSAFALKWGGSHTMLRMLAVANLACLCTYGVNDTHLASS